MERLKLVNVPKATFLGSEFHTFTIHSLKMLLLPEMHEFLHNLYLWPWAEGRMYDICGTYGTWPFILIIQQCSAMF